MGFRLFTDGTCDLNREMIEARGIDVFPFQVSVAGGDYLYSYNGDPNNAKPVDVDEFFKLVRGGNFSQTAQINPETYKEVFEPILKGGEDILYIAFSSGLSGSAGNAQLVANELNEMYANKLVVVDSLSASTGQGLVVYLADERRKAGASIEETKEYVLDNMLYVHHWFTVDDLNHLKHAGRVSGAAAFFGTVLSIKPVLDTDNEGHLVAREKVQGRKKALKMLVDKMEENCGNIAEAPIFLSHADALEDATLVREMIKKRFGRDVNEFCRIGPIVGGHSGPSTVALFFLGTQKRV